MIGVCPRCNSSSLYQHDPDGDRDFVCCGVVLVERAPLGRPETGRSPGVDRNGVRERPSHYLPNLGHSAEWARRKLGLS